MPHFGMSDEERYGNKSGFSNLTVIILVIITVVYLIFAVSDSNDQRNCDPYSGYGSGSCTEVDSGPEQFYP